MEEGKKQGELTDVEKAKLSGLTKEELAEVMNDLCNRGAFTEIGRAKYIEQKARHYLYVKFFKEAREIVSKAIEQQVIAALKGETHYIAADGEMRLILDGIRIMAGQLKITLDGEAHNLAREKLVKALEQAAAERAKIAEPVIQAAVAGDLSKLPEAGKFGKAAKKIMDAIKGK